MRLWLSAALLAVSLLGSAAFAQTIAPLTPPVQADLATLADPASQERLAAARRLAAIDYAAIGLTFQEIQALRAEIVDVLASGGDGAGALALAEVALSAEQRQTPASPSAIVDWSIRVATLASRQNLPARAYQVLDAATAVSDLHFGPLSATSGRLLELKLTIGGDITSSAAEFAGVRSRVAAIRAAQPDDVQIMGSGGVANPNAAFRIVQVHYGTSRARTDEGDPLRVYSSERGALDHGVVSVSVPANRSLGEIPRPALWRGEFRPDPARHTIVTRLSRFPGAREFIAAVRRRVEASQRREVLIFIHGFATDFPTAAMRTALLAEDLELDGAPLMYSWPSRGSLVGYVADGAQNTRPIANDLAGFLQLVAQESNARRISIVAHSMGNRFLIEALEQIDRRYDANARAPFADIVFASPDVDAADFSARIPALRRLAGRTTLYTSSRDRALQISRQFNGGYHRAGDASAQISIPALDTVDATSACATTFCHEEFAGSALDDFRAVIWWSLDPSARCLLDRKAAGGWLVRQDARGCDVATFQTAIRMVRRLGKSGAEQVLERQIASLRAAGDQQNAARWTSIMRVVQRLPST